MIVSFSVTNFRSFSSEETFSLVASNRLSGKHEEHAVAIPDSDERVLRTAVLYGANGAGKSNLFKALRYLKSFVTEPRSKSSGTGREAFRFSESAAPPSVFDLQFVVENKLYRFGLKVDDHRVMEEWLTRVVGGREKAIYERVTADDGAVTIDAPGLKGVKVLALATVGGPQNQSFIATVLATLEPPDYGDELGAILTWFKKGLRLVSPYDSSVGSLGNVLAQDSDLLKFDGDFLRASSTGVDHLEVLRDETSPNEFTSLLKEHLVWSEVNGSVTVHVGGGSAKEFVVDTTDNQLKRIRIQAAHEYELGKMSPIDLTEESDGTQRLLNLIPALHDLHKCGGVYFIDEIDRSLHPMLVRNFLEHFLKSCEGSQRQLIMTTHESNLLDQELLRRDEIWFAEKDPAGATHLYSLIDFKVRNDLEIRKHYLQGRFGAVPFLGDPGRLPTETNQPV